MIIAYLGWAAVGLSGYLGAERLGPISTFSLPPGSYHIRHPMKQEAGLPFVTWRSRDGREYRLTFWVVRHFDGMPMPLSAISPESWQSLQTGHTSHVTEESVVVDGITTTVKWSGESLGRDTISVAFTFRARLGDADLDITIWSEGSSRLRSKLRVGCVKAMEGIVRTWHWT